MEARVVHRVPRTPGTHHFYDIYAGYLRLYLYLRYSRHKRTNRQSVTAVLVRNTHLVEALAEAAAPREDVHGRQGRHLGLLPCLPCRHLGDR